MIGKSDLNQQKHSPSSTQLTPVLQTKIYDPSQKEIPNQLLFPSQEIPLLNHTPSMLILEPVLECHPRIGEDYSDPGFTKHKTSIEFPDPSQDIFSRNN